MSATKQQARSIRAGASFPPPAPADYSDELSQAQIEALRVFAPQDESKMGALVHELTW